MERKENITIKDRLSFKISKTEGVRQRALGARERG